MKPEVLPKSCTGSLPKVRYAYFSYRVPDISRIEFDAELIRMALEGEIFLYTHDDPLETTDEDRVNAVLFTGENCYIVYSNPNYIPPKKAGRGGKRAGAGGRYKFNGLPTKPVRVPIQFEKQIIEFAQQLANSSNTH